MPAPMAAIWLFCCVLPLLGDRALSPALSSPHLSSYTSFWMVREICGRKRLRGSKTLWGLWSLGTLTNARGQRGERAYSRGSQPKGGKGQGFVIEWGNSLGGVYFPFPGVQGCEAVDWQLCYMLSACPALNKLETREKSKEKWMGVIWNTEHLHVRY